MNTPSDTELFDLAKRGKDSYSLATDSGWSERESNLAAYQYIYAHAVNEGLEAEQSNLTRIRELEFAISEIRAKIMSGSSHQLATALMAITDRVYPR